MTLRTKTLTAVAALTISAAGLALAQDGSTTVTTVPLEQPGAAQPAPEGGTTFVATPAEDAAGADAQPSDDGAAAVVAVPAPEPEVEVAEPVAPAVVVTPEDEDADAVLVTPEAVTEIEPEVVAPETEGADEPEVVVTPEAADEMAAEPEVVVTPEAEAEMADDAEVVVDPEAEIAAEPEVVVVEPEAEAEAEAEVMAEDGTVPEAGEGGGAHAAEAATVHHEAHIEDVAFSFEGPFGTYDQFQLQRGLQVYTEVCAACHGMKFVPIRALANEGGPALPEDQVRAYAAGLTEITDDETGEDRLRLPTDHFPTVTGMGMGPDLSLMAKARAGFHGPYGTGISQFFRGIGGPEYIHALLTGYTGEEMEQAGSIFYENTAFSTGYISMPPPLSDELVTYEDGTIATVDQMARDVSAFMMWTAEPKMMDRKMVGLVAVLFLIVLTALLYLTNKRIWAPHKRKRLDH